MHPRQAKLITTATEVGAKIGEPQKEAASAIVWKYEDETTGQPFYLLERRMTVRSPWSGQSMTVRPERISPSNIGKDVKQEFAAPAPDDMAMMASEADKPADKTASEKSWKA